MPTTFVRRLISAFNRSSGLVLQICVQCALEKVMNASMSFPRSSVVLRAIHATDIRYVVRDSALMVRHADRGWRKFDQLSDGQLRLASIFCDLAMRCAVLNSHLGEDCKSRRDLETHDSPQMRRAIVATAVAKGGYSIWQDVFAGDLEMQKELTSSFPGTRRPNPVGLNIS